MFTRDILPHIMYVHFTDLEAHLNFQCRFTLLKLLPKFHKSVQYLMLACSYTICFQNVIGKSAISLSTSRLRASDVCSVSRRTNIFFCDFLSEKHTELYFSLLNIFNSSFVVCIHRISVLDANEADRNTIQEFGTQVVFRYSIHFRIMFFIVSKFLLEWINLVNKNF